MSLCTNYRCPGDLTRTGRCSSPVCPNPDNPQPVDNGQEKVYEIVPTGDQYRLVVKVDNLIIDIYESSPRQVADELLRRIAPDYTTTPVRRRHTIKRST